MGRTATDEAQMSEAQRARVDRAAAARDRDAAALLLYEAELARQAAAADRDRAALSLHQAGLERAASQTDWLTGALHRGPGLVALQLEIDRARRVGADLAIGFVDVDGLKHVNDTRGHAAGDHLLRAVVVGLRASVRSYDVIARYGGDEFVYSLAGADDDAAAERFETMRRSFVHVNGDSVSAGFAALRDGDTLDMLVARADANLYQRRRPEREHGDGPRATPATMLL
jgi:diguanylate cyclase (GGDEF)-like protein